MKTAGSDETSTPKMNPKPLRSLSIPEEHAMYSRFATCSGHNCHLE